MPIGKDNSKSSSSSSSSGSSSSGGVYSRGGEIIETGENDLDLGGLPRHHVTPTEGSINHHDNTQYGAGSGVLIMNAKNDDRTASFFAQPGILAGKSRKQLQQQQLSVPSSIERLDSSSFTCACTNHNNEFLVYV